MTRTITVTIDGVARDIAVLPGERLIDVVRAADPAVEAGVGCAREGRCGACTLLVEDRAVKACLMLAAQADGKTVTTLGGLKRGERPHTLRIAFETRGAAPCGLCRSGIILTAAEHLREKPNPTAGEVRAALTGTPCPCGEDAGIIEAVLMAASAITSGKPIKPADDG